MQFLEWVRKVTGEDDDPPRLLRDIENSVYSHSSHIFRLTRPEVRSLAEINAELTFCALATKSLNPDALFPTVCSGPIAVLEGKVERIGVAFELISGVVWAEKMGDDAFVSVFQGLGRVLRGLHGLIGELESCGAAASRPRLGWDGGNLETRINRARAEKNPLLDPMWAHVDAVEAKARAFTDRAIERGEYGLIHADLHGGNVGRIGDDRLVVIDFDDSGRAPLAYDVGVIWGWLVFHGRPAERALSELERGYGRGFDREEVAAFAVSHLCTVACWIVERAQESEALRKETPEFLKRLFEVLGRL
jgi:Ser/Thr protein kinase RdoA (MazF antagonist)